LAAPISFGCAMSGRMALRAGKKIPLIASCSTVSVYSSHTSPGLRTSRNPITITNRLKSESSSSIRRL
jgi:hypothetical protein